MVFIKWIREFVVLYFILGFMATVSSKLVGRWHGQWSDILWTALLGTGILMGLTRFIDKTFGLADEAWKSFVRVSQRRRKTYLPGEEPWSTPLSSGQSTADMPKSPNSSVPPERNS